MKAWLPQFVLFENAAEFPCLAPHKSRQRQRLRHSAIKLVFACTLEQIVAERHRNATPSKTVNARSHMGILSLNRVRALAYVSATGM